jgi:hypothetical protein
MTTESKCYMCYQGIAAGRHAPFVLGDAIRQRIEGVRHVRRGRVCTRHVLEGAVGLTGPLRAGRMFCEHRVDAVA